MSMPGFVQRDWDWWMRIIPVANRAITEYKFIRTIFSDASLSGWGAFCESANGLWDETERSLHINHLELKAALLALKCFAAGLRDAEILLKVDNTTTMAYINRMGGVRFAGLHDLACDFWSWCEERRLWVHATYMSSKENCEADYSSRIDNTDTEWELADATFDEITKCFGTMEVDLFASRINSKCQLYCSWRRDPEAFAFDALTISWTQWFFYAFPPFSLIARVIKKIRDDRAEGILVVPFWPTQNWFPASQRLIVGDWVKASPVVIEAYAGCRQVVSQTLLRRGTPKEAIDITIASLEDSTLKQYNGTLNLWWQWNQQASEDPFEVLISKTLKFLSERFEQGIGHSALNAARAALSLISSIDIANNALVTRFIKGTYKMRPSLPKYHSTWDVDPVLEKLASFFPLDSLSLKDLSNKLIVLLALGTAHRAQTLAFKVTNIEILESRIEIRIPDRIKTSRRGVPQPLLKVPFFTEKPELCVAKTLIKYLEVTKKLRIDTDTLFISFNKPHGPVKSEAISRWIRAALISFGVDKKFTAHSTRHASTSKAYERGVSVQEIKKVAGWSPTSQIFATFYKQPCRKWYQPCYLRNLEVRDTKDN
ncbi:uncharacterized protein LOC141532667 [Cotesia typhae]|uniref:uncharacterized protein LOC141532667 n=1 Tax=Cotesia typhae TaxID=2053667 RepID=UPI003D696BD2